MIFGLAFYQLVQREHVPLRQVLLLDSPDRADLNCESEEDLKAGLQFCERRRQPGVNRLPTALAANLADASAPALLQRIVLAGDPGEERTHRYRESALLGSLLAVGENG